MTSAHDQPIEHVDLTTERGLFQLLSSSSTVYYVDTRRGTIADEHTGAKMLRARGYGPTGVGPTDDEWVPLYSVRSIPVRDRADGYQEIDPTREEEQSVLRVGCRHLMTYDMDPLYDGWWIGREVEQIVRLTRMPPASRRTKEETGGRQW